MTDECGIPIGREWPEIDAVGLAELDLLIEHVPGIAGAAWTERAGQAAADLAVRRYFDGCPHGRRITVLAGSGAKAASALSTGSRLAQRGAEVRVVLSDPAAPARGSAVAAQLAMLAAIGVQPRSGDDANADPADLLIDGLRGCSQRGASRGGYSRLIDCANAQKAPVLALDIPTGFDVDSGTVRHPVIRADATLTLALPKRGLTAECLQHAVGALYLADMGIPAALYGRMAASLCVPSFNGAPVLRLLRRSECHDGDGDAARRGTSADGGCSGARTAAGH